MQLLYTKFSPFSRKVLVLSHERGLISKIEAVGPKSARMCRSIRPRMRRYRRATR
jgi:glutathione S-transferase